LLVIYVSVSCYGLVILFIIDHRSRVICIIVSCWLFFCVLLFVASYLSYCDCWVVSYLLYCWLLVDSYFCYCLLL